MAQGLTRQNLSTDDLRHYQRMLDDTTETQTTMTIIDEIITTFGGFPGAFV